MTSGIEQTRAAVLRFAASVIAADRAQIAAAAAPDITWTVPGHGKISGTYRGPEEVYRYARTLADFGYQIGVQQVTFGLGEVAVVIRGTGTHDGRAIDVGQVNVLQLADDRVAAVRTFFSDIDSVDGYFA